MNKKTIILENGHIQDIPEELIRFLEKYEKQEWEWYDMRQKFWPENREKTIGFFAGLPEGQHLACHTVFDGFQQLELMIQLLHKLKDKKFVFYIMQGMLCNNLLEFLDKNESSITPKELDELLEGNLTDEECEAIYEQIYEFKRNINKQLEEVLSSHEVYWVKPYGEKIRLSSLQDIKDNKYDF